jgi:hypothetical protein
MCEEEEEASTRLAQMQQLVRQAEFEAAERVGNLGEIPLAVAKEALVNRTNAVRGRPGQRLQGRVARRNLPRPRF